MISTAGTSHDLPVGVHCMKPLHEEQKINWQIGSIFRSTTSLQNDCLDKGKDET